MLTHSKESGRKQSSQFLHGGSGICQYNSCLVMGGTYYFSIQNIWEEMKTLLSMRLIVQQQLFHSFIAFLFKFIFLFTLKAPFYLAVKGKRSWGPEMEYGYIFHYTSTVGAKEPFVSCPGNLSITPNVRRSIKKKPNHK